MGLSDRQAISSVLKKLGKFECTDCEWEGQELVHFKCEVCIRRYRFHLDNYVKKEQ